VNTSTPRIFIAATEQNTGKTTTSLGLYADLRDRFGRIGFIKPVGQRFTEVEGKRIDEDSVLIQRTFDTQTPIEDMSPIAVEPQFTRRYINHANHDALVRRIQHAFDRACWEKDFAIIEGTGHAGVGSVFDLSNARVAHLLQSKVLLITPGGIGRPIDEAAVNKALFDREGVEVIGVVMNKVRADKIESITDTVRKGFDRIGLELLGVIPEEHILTQPTIDQVCELIRGDFLHRESAAHRRIANVTIGAMSSANLFRDIAPHTLLVVPGDREDVVLATLSRAVTSHHASFCGVVLSDDLRPNARLMELMESADVPIVASSLDSYTIASRIHSMTVKTLPGDTQKIDRIQALVSHHVAVERILEKLTA
jgi:hypothetical protein